MKEWILLLGAVLPFCLNAQSISSGSCGENCQYTVEDDTISFAPIDSSKPATIQNYDHSCSNCPITFTGCCSTAPWFSNSNITKVDIKDGIVSVGDSAFAYQPSITEVNLPEGLQTIGRWAMHRTGITSIDLPESLTEIGNWAFVTKSLTEVNGSMENVTKLDDMPFADTALTDFVMPPNITDFSVDVFMGNNPGYQSNNLTNLYCPEALAAQCAAAIAYRGDAAQVTSYDYKGGVYVIKDEDGNETYYLSGDNMKNGQMCEGTLSECKKEALINRGVCSGSDCDALVAADNGGYLLKVGSKTYQNINALLKGDYDRRRIYTIEEAIFVAGDKNRVSITYR